MQVEANPNIAKPTLGLGMLRKAGECLEKQNAMLPNKPSETATEPAKPPSKKAKRRAFNVAVLAAQRRAHERNEPLPFVEITGETAQGPFGNSSRGTIRHWTRLIAAELAKLFPEEADAAMEFTFRHSLSVANAFHRRILKGDVVAELARLYNQESLLRIVAEVTHANL